MPPQLVEFDAIWDTGATNSVVTQGVIDGCGLAPTGMTMVHGIHGAKQAETYLVNVALPNEVVFTGVRVTKGDIRGADMLIGMDIIGQGDFSVTNCQGFSKFSYRTPSIEHIDYVEQYNKIHPQGGASRADRRRAKKGR